MYGCLVQVQDFSAITLNCREDENDVSDEDADRIDFTVTANREKELRHIQATIIQAHEGCNLL